LPRIINLALSAPSSVDEADSTGTADAHRPVHETSNSKGGVAIVVGALGVVFGDIGTSPLYALRECFSPIHGIAVMPDNVLGLLSLIFWCLALIITVKYVGIVLEADNRGEGGILALSALLVGASRNWRIWTPVSAIGLFGAALFFGDGFITPAISVMSAIEGLAVAAPNLHNVVMPGAALILTCLFFVQKRGTAVMGRAFGPVIIAWFATLAVLGIRGILLAPQVLAAINPAHAARFFMDNGVAGFITLSSVFLCVTGGEALYADMGHFGRGPIRKGWLFVVLPALLLNYFGQGALLLTDPEAIRNPFYLLAPAWALVPLILLATAATVIASQAVISGVFSIARQAINMGYLPRLRVLHSSEHSIGQVYVPAVNWLLFICTLTLVILFGSSSALAGAYGIAIVCDMVVTSVMVIMLLRIADAKGNRAVIGVLAIILVFEARRWWLDPVGDCIRDLPADEHLAGRTARPGLARCQAAGSGTRIPCIHHGAEAEYRAGHGRLSRERRRRHSACAFAEPEVQRCHARTHHPADVREHGTAPRTHRKARGYAHDFTRNLPRHCALRLHGSAGHPVGLAGCRCQGRRIPA
jgi:K+ transporter